MEQKNLIVLVRGNTGIELDLYSYTLAMTVSRSYREDIVKICYACGSISHSFIEHHHEHEADRSLRQIWSI